VSIPNGNQNRVNNWTDQYKVYTIFTH